ncbi:chaperone modulator CbpM [Winogradskyella vidalii]|uniref:chaperone modulator CbpM n=1 Tax=Winogradskyella vidalii TaxID=2615024 RepID=UPI0015C96B46|nr:chaperone modulator CbpM [Winogradskyella vidalii]
MKDTHLIPVPRLCTHYQIEMSFFDGLNDYGLIEYITIEKTYCIHQDKIADVEKMIRLHQDLHLNFEGIDTVFNLLDKIETLQSELHATQNRLKLFEE